MKKSLQKIPLSVLGMKSSFLVRIPKLHYKIMSHHCFLMYAKEDPTL